MSIVNRTASIFIAEQDKKYVQALRYYIYYKLVYREFSTRFCFLEYKLFSDGFFRIGAKKYELDGVINAIMTGKDEIELIT